MKIAVLSSFAGSLIDFRGSLLREMVRLGHEVVAFAPDHDVRTRTWLLGNGITPVDYTSERTGINPIQDLWTVHSMHRALREHKPDVVLSYFIKPVIYGTLAAKVAGVSRRYALIAGLGFAFTSDGKLSWRRSAIQRIVRFLYRLSLPKATRVIFMNGDDQAHFAAEGLITSHQSAVLGGTGVNLAEWPVCSPKTDPVTFVFVGRILRDKGVEEFVAAAKIVRQKYPATRFLLVGGHDANPSAIPIKRIRQWASDGIIEWPGHVSVRPWLSQASVFVLPSYREGVPRSTQEAMATGLPIITTDVPGCRETVVDGRNGFLVSARDSVALAAAMCKFIVQPSRIPSMGHESRKMAEERFDIEKQNRKLLAFMDM